MVKNKSGPAVLFPRGMAEIFSQMRSPSDQPNVVSDKLRMLTNREQEIVSLVCTGVSNKAIARNIGVTEGTVKAHLNQIYRKVGVQNRAGLIISFCGDRDEGHAGRR
jgi:DNA-binding NarL/FixJ family response regulator